MSFIDGMSVFSITLDVRGVAAQPVVDLPLHHPAQGLVDEKRCDDRHDDEGEEEGDDSHAPPRERATQAPRSWNRPCDGSSRCHPVERCKRPATRRRHALCDACLGTYV
jgi:hypothetical protein